MHISEGLRGSFRRKSQGIACLSSCQWDCAQAALLRLEQKDASKLRAHSVFQNVGQWSEQFCSGFSSYDNQRRHKGINYETQQYFKIKYGGVLQGRSVHMKWFMLRKFCERR
jgi:hypothetical protein